MFSITITWLTVIKFLAISAVALIGGFISYIWGMALSVGENQRKLFAFLLVISISATIAGICLIIMFHV